MKKVPIRIIDKDFKLYGELDTYSSLIITRSFAGIGNLEMHINRHTKHADKLARGRIVFPYNKLNKAYIIKYKEIEIDEDGKATENFIIRAESLKSWFAQRITMPENGKSNDSINADAESVMRHLVNNNAIDPLNAERKFDNVVFEDNNNKGIILDWQSRYKVLSEELEKVGLLSNLGWNIELDFENEVFVFKVLESRDLTTSQDLLPPAIFSPEFDTLSNMSYLESELDYKNHAIVAGQGEGKDRRIIEVDDNFIGFNRHELFVDARDVEEETDADPPVPIPAAKIEERLINRGNEKLLEHEQEIYLDGQASSKAEKDYEFKWDLGDLVTVQNKEWNVTMDIQITEVTEVYEVDGLRIEVIFGDDRPNLISKIKESLSTIDIEITK